MYITCISFINANPTRSILYAALKHTLLGCASIVLVVIDCVDFNRSIHFFQKLKLKTDIQPKYPQYNLYAYGEG